MFTHVKGYNINKIGVNFKNHLESSPSSNEYALFNNEI